jgi:hypothetical protein
VANPKIAIFHKRIFRLYLACKEFANGLSLKLFLKIPLSAADYFLIF